MKDLIINNRKFVTFTIFTILLPFHISPYYGETKICLSAQVIKHKILVKAHFVKAK